MIKSLRGMKEILPPQNKKYEHFIEVASSIAKKYGFEFIETPILEETALYIRSVGDSSDIVGKEMYSFIDKGKNDVSLRPEGTAGVVRSFIQQKYDKAGQVKRFFYYGPMFRYERPQKGRFRQFHQFGCESFGEDSYIEDINIILMMGDIFDKLNIEYTIKLNSLGCDECTPPYRKKLVKFLDTNIEEICDDCKTRRDTNPIRTLDCKNPNCQSLYVNAPKITTNLCQNCDSDFEKIKKILNSMNIKYEVDSNLVRGLDYYNKSAFEFISEGLAIAGGGRYDKLTSMLGGKDTPAIGFAIGIERIIELIEIPEDKKDGYYIGTMCEDLDELLLTLAHKKRKENKVHLNVNPKSLKATLKSADKLGFKYCVFIGEDEVKDNKIWIKDLQEKTELLINQKDF
ncbi:MAG: Histidyl-tRNA synthetase (EC [uncultured Campylobacterales bacterium]|uniref:Histidine--tRNA ligase n=1 Tax=uncultured Campylobacterales bacterium TaxID=352960 RepID=A0A6S6SZ15_9BACT|nr:MAG: Histidyl-tRNA synthetase (EC [uncultured Campylobacterales bacterium]